MCVTTSIKTPFFTRNFRVWDHSEFSPLRETHRFSQGSGSVEATRQHAARARLAEELTFHSSIWQMINSDYRPAELGLAKPVVYARLSHPEHSGKGSETRGIQGAKHRPPGRLHVGADEAGGAVHPRLPAIPSFAGVHAKTPQPSSRRQVPAPRELRQEPARGWLGCPMRLPITGAGKQPSYPCSPPAPTCPQLPCSRKAAVTAAAAAAAASCRRRGPGRPSSLHRHLHRGTKPQAGQGEAAAPLQELAFHGFLCST